jgi:hypothetical protein
MSRRFVRDVLVVALVLLAGCAGQPPLRHGVRLETGSGPPLSFKPLAEPAPVHVTEAAFRKALARLVLEVPLAVRTGRAAEAQVVPVSAAVEQVDWALRQALRQDYGRWCERNAVPGDCLSLLQDGLHLNARGRLQLALGFAFDTVWAGVEAAVEDALNPMVLKALVVSALAPYVLLLAAPEPAMTKGVALVLTGYLVAYLGMGPFWGMVRACRELVAASQRATTFTELEEAGHRFGRVLGANGARIVLLALTASLGGRAAMLKNGPTLPGYAQATVHAEALLALRLPAIAEVHSFVLSSAGTVVVRLAPTATAMMAQGPTRESPRRADPASDEGLLPFGPRATQSGQPSGVRWTRLNGRNYSINSEHAWSRGHQSGLPPSGTGIGRDALESAIIRDLDAFLRAGGTVPAPSRLNVDRLLTVNGIRYGYRSVTLPSNEVRVTTYWVAP